MKRLRTTLAAAALAATGLSVPAASAASAAVPDSSATADASRTTVLARVGNHGRYCYGKAVRRCIWFQHDSTHHRFRAYAGIRDMAGGHNWSVKVTNVHLRDPFDASRIGRMNNDYDGWHPYADHARGWWWYCEDGKGYYLQGIAHFSWKGHSRGGESIASDAVLVVC